MVGHGERCSRCEGTTSVHKIVHQWLAITPFLRTGRIPRSSLSAAVLWAALLRTCLSLEVPACGWALIQQCGEGGVLAKRSQERIASSDVGEPPTRSDGLTQPAACFVACFSQRAHSG